MKNLKKQEISSSLPIYVRIFKFRNSVIRLILVFLFLFISVFGINSSSDLSTGSNLTDSQAIYIISIHEKFKSKLIIETKNYITKIAPASKLNPEYVVLKCLEYDIDIIFVLAQALLESHFGTKGKAIKTNSVWNVGTYDNGKILYKYSHPNESVDPYLKLINEEYLVGFIVSGDTIYKDLYYLVQDRGYINYRGDRFASSQGYEKGLRNLMIRIDMETSISFYQDILRLSHDDILAYFGPSENLEINDPQLQTIK